MRVTIEIDDQDQAAATEVSVEDGTSSSDPSAPPADLAARAAAMGAISAGPAPTQAMDTGTPGAPAITGPADQPVAAATDGDGSGASSAGAAPGRPDADETGSVES